MAWSAHPQSLPTEILFAVIYALCQTIRHDGEDVSCPARHALCGKGEIGEETQRKLLCGPPHNIVLRSAIMQQG
jgi:hypothetical protein